MRGRRVITNAVVSCGRSCDVPSLHDDAGELTRNVQLSLQDKAKVLEDVRAIISTQLGTELEKVRSRMLTRNWPSYPLRAGMVL